MHEFDAKIALSTSDPNVLTRMYRQESRIDGDPAPNDAARDAIRCELCAGRRRREIVGEDDRSFYPGLG